MDSPVDVGGFAEPRKILCQCALPSFEQLSVHHRSNSLTLSSLQNEVFPLSSMVFDLVLSIFYTFYDDLTLLFVSAAKYPEPFDEQ
jgi:hypothetical protein